MSKVRAAAVAGAFYPAQTRVLTHELLELMSRTHRDGAQTAPLQAKALIVPHAGYIYSGSTAAQAYESLALRKEQIQRVVLLGPAHRVPVRGLALPSADWFETPLGRVKVDHDAASLLTTLPQVVINEAAHAMEHSIEVQLPFLQTVLTDFALVPLVVGKATPTEVSEVLDKLWGGPETLIVISSDLSHYLPYPAACAVDGNTVRQILSLDHTLTHEQACGGTPVNGLLLLARQRGLQPHLLGYCNSGDTAGDRRHVVGYASFAFTEAPHGRA